MAWRLKMKARKAPPGMDQISEKLQEFEARTREALNTPPDDKRRNEITWPMHKLHFEKNRYLYDMHRRHEISKQLLDYLIHQKIADGKLIAKWRRPGYETVCSLIVITKSNTNFGSVGVCRVRLQDRKGQILPNVLTGCVSCASGDGGPIWWDDPVPDIVRRRIAEVDPGKAELLEDDGLEGEEEEVAEGGRKAEGAEKEDRYEEAYEHNDQDRREVVGDEGSDDGVNEDVGESLGESLGEGVDEAELGVESEKVTSNVGASSGRIRDQD